MYTYIASSIQYFEIHIVLYISNLFLFIAKCSIIYEYIEFVNSFTSWWALGSLWFWLLQIKSMNIHVQVFECILSFLLGKQEWND